MKNLLWVGLIIAAGIWFYKSLPSPDSLPTEEMQKELARDVSSQVQKVLNSNVAIDSAFDLKPKKVQNNTTAEIKLKIIDEIFLTKNDNDPRLDSEFRHLSEDDKSALQNKYFTQPKERLNERGTLVFLLGREIKNSNDLNFMKSVLQEEPCKSFEFCNKTMADEKDEHHGADDLTLSYPQAMALKSVLSLLQQEAPGVGPEVGIDSLKRHALEIAKEATQSENEVISKMAQNALEEINPN